jgi:hypothetical protein
VAERFLNLLRQAAGQAEPEDEPEQASNATAPEMHG